MLVYGVLLGVEFTKACWHKTMGALYLSLTSASTCLCLLMTTLYKVPATVLRLVINSKETHMRSIPAAVLLASGFRMGR